MKHLISISIVSLVLLGGCFGSEPTEAPPDLSLEVPWTDWQLAPAGCENASLDGAQLAAAAGEPQLGVLISADGTLLCVDSRAVLAEELAEHDLGARTDPSPQPSHPGIIDPFDDARPGVTPTPVLLRQETDPTPTPVIEEYEGNREDPTPTPV